MQLFPDTNLHHSIIDYSLVIVSHLLKVDFYFSNKKNGDIKFPPLEILSYIIFYDNQKKKKN